MNYEAKTISIIAKNEKKALEYQRLMKYLNSILRALGVWLDMFD